ncbi:MAG: mechanosensitive ion channel [gamma proteobacterium endosymbiont of Lamellibrachia anaximandri]|nr:mechanosensitive ion channel [gamma proteobacterium endosymbiont of Lamellibrachia anaximandri]MBL3618189.1 mechanosensitive ion channel [gamma proteobacterium endosymbiont of Lamellibrachia anaximandri]
MKLHSSSLIRYLCILPLLGLLLPLQGLAEEQEAPVSEVTESAPDSLRSPRAVMETFLGAMNDIKRGEPERISDALETLDLTSVNALVRTERGVDLAWLLLETMDRTRLVDLQRIPDRHEGEPWVFQRYAKGALRISRYSDGRWLFDNETIARLPAIWEEVSARSKVEGLSGDDSVLPWHLRIQNAMPALLKKTVFLLENWRWLGIFFIVLFGVVADKLISLLLRRLVSRWRRETRRLAFRDISEDMLRPLGLLAMSAIWWVGITLLGLPESTMLVLLVAVKFLAALSGVWVAYRLVDLVGGWLTERAMLTETRLDDALVPLIPRTLKIFVTVIGVIFIADNMNINVSGLLAGLGLGGLAFALAAKDMVQNLFGSVTILLDRTFSVGDWIVVDGKEGAVERIGFRSTRIRTFYNSVLTVPNSLFITVKVDNMGERRYRRLSTKLGLAYETPPEKIDSFCEGVRELVRQHPYMRKDYYHVYFNGYADSALEILVYVFWETPDWGTELRERHRFLLDILRLAQGLGVEFAYPTQTLYMKQEGESDGGSGSSTSRKQALDEGREIARNIVSETTGLGERPPPVKF